MKKITVLALAIAASLAFSCKTKKLAAKPEPTTIDRNVNDDELDKIKKDMPVDDVERTESGIKFTFSSEVLFPSNSSYLSDAAKVKLAEMAKYLSTKEAKQIQIDGHTDATGTAEYNVWLSDKRAASVKTFLVAQGIAESRVRTAGKGASQPIADNKTPEGRLKNRRVEIILLK